MVSQLYEMDCLVTEITDAQGSSYWLKAWNNEDQELGFAIDLEQIVDIMTEIPDSLVQEDYFVSRDFLVTVHMNSDLWVRVTEYESGESGSWDPEDGGPVSWEDWTATEKYLDLMPLDNDEDTDIEDDDWDPDNDLDEDEWIEGDAEDFLGEGEDEDD